MSAVCRFHLILVTTHCDQSNIIFLSTTKLLFSSPIPRLQHPTTAPAPLLTSLAFSCSVSQENIIIEICGLLLSIKYLDFYKPWLFRLWCSAGAPSLASQLPCNCLVQTKLRTSCETKINRHNIFAAKETIKVDCRKSELIIKFYWCEVELTCGDAQ